MKSGLTCCIAELFLRLRIPTVAPLLTLLVLPFVTTVSAQTITTLLPPALTFNDDGEISVPGWTPNLYTTSGSIANTFSAQTMHSESWLRIRRYDGNANSGQLTYSASTLSDFVGSVILGSNSWNSSSDAIGVILRASTGTFGNTSAYYLAVNNAGLTLYYGLAGEFTLGDVVDSRILARSALLVGDALKILNSTTNNQYRLEFSFIGNVLDASLWELGAGVGGSDLLISTLTYTDERPQFRASGYFALRGGRFGGNRSAYFRDLYIGTPQIPEPETAGLVLLGGILAGGLWIRRAGLSRGRV